MEIWIIRPEKLLDAAPVETRACETINAIITIA